MTYYVLRTHSNQSFKDHKRSASQKDQRRRFHMTAYYNDNDPFAAAWLRNLIGANLKLALDIEELI